MALCRFRLRSVFREKQLGQFVGIDVVDAGQAGFDRAGHLAGQKAHRVEGVLGEVIGEQLVVAVELFVIDHRHHPALVGVDQIGELEFGIVQVQGHGANSHSPQSDL